MGEPGAKGWSSFDNTSQLDGILPAPLKPTGMRVMANIQ